MADFKTNRGPHFGHPVSIAVTNMLRIGRLIIEDVLYVCIFVILVTTDKPNRVTESV